MKALYGFIDDFRSEYENGEQTISENIQFSMRKTVRQITHYILSKYLEPDAQDGRFRNVGNAIVDLEWRAKNIDRKNIEAHATDGDHIFSLVVNKEVQQWMKTNNFGKTIDDYQRKKSEYGSVLLKRTEVDGELLIEPVKWEHMIVDPADIDGGPKIEKHNLTLLDLKKKTGVWTEAVDGELGIDLAIAAAKRRKERRIEVLDIEGEFEYCDIYPEEDSEDDTIGLYNIIIAVVGSKKYCLFKTKLSESRFKHDRRKEVEGRDFGMGVWEECFEPQIAINEAELDEREAMSLGGKVVVTTNKKNTPSALTIRNGEVIELEADEYFTPISLAPQALPEFQNRIDAWFANMQRDQSAFAGVTGEEPKASTPFASLALQAAQGGSIFNKRRDQDGYFLLEVITDWVNPFVIEQINKDHVLTASYSPSELQMLDDAIRTFMLDEHSKTAMLSDAMLQPGMPHGTLPEHRVDLGMQIDQQLQKTGQHRTLTVPKDYITAKQIAKKVRFDITDEMKDDQRELNALATTLQSLAPTDPARAAVIGQMMEIMGISAASYPISAAAPAAQDTTKPAAPSKINAVLPAGQQA